MLFILGTVKSSKDRDTQPVVIGRNVDWQ